MSKHRVNQGNEGGFLHKQLGFLQGLLAVAALLCATWCGKVVAVDYTVGGTDTGVNWYASLEALRTSGVLLSGDTIIITTDDDSLTVPFSVDNLTFRGTGIISPEPSRSIALLSNSNSSVTLDSNSLEFNGFKSSAIDVREVTIAGGSNTFNANTKETYGGAIQIYGGAIHNRQNVNINDGENTFSGNSANYGGAIFGEQPIMRPVPTAKSSSPQE